MRKERRRDDVRDKEGSGGKRKQKIIRDRCAVLNLVPSFLPSYIRGYLEYGDLVE